MDAHLGYERFSPAAAAAGEIENATGRRARGSSEITDAGDRTPVTAKGDSNATRKKRKCGLRMEEDYSLYAKGLTHTGHRIGIEDLYA